MIEKETMANPTKIEKSSNEKSKPWRKEQPQIELNSHQPINDQKHQKSNFQKQDTTYKNALSSSQL